jgi:hypothetical protein
MGRYNPTSSNSPRPTARKTQFLSIMSGEGDSWPRQLILDNVIESKITKMDAVGMLRAKFNAAKPKTIQILMRTTGSRQWTQQAEQT